MLWAFHASLTDAGLTGRSARNPSWVGLENYQRLLTDPVFPLSVLLTVVFVAGSAGDVPGAEGVGLPVVWHNRVGASSAGGSPLAVIGTLDPLPLLVRGTAH